MASLPNQQAVTRVFVVAGRYEIKDPPIGQGGMGVIYKAYDKTTRRYVALKTIWGEVSTLALSMFEKEWSVLARLSHPNIVDIIETGQFDDAGQKKPFFVMPLLPGATLDQLIKNASQRLTVERTIDIMAQACRGLQAAHDQGLIHRDLKPSNIFVLDDDSAKIIDFGVVHLADNVRSITGMKGTLHFLAPELLDHKAPSILSDVYALGVVCYETLTRRRPFARPNYEETIEAIRTYIPPPVSDINGAVNDMVSRTVHKAMAKQPYHRFSSVREFAEVLRKALRNEPIEYFDSSKIQPRIERAKRAQGEGDYQFAKEILTELEAEGHIDLQISLVRMQLDQAIKLKTIRQLLESARTRIEEEEYPLALQKVQEALEIDANHADALQLKSQIEQQRNTKQVEGWYRLVQQHIDNQLFSQARLGVDEILRINPADTKAHALMTQLDRQEKSSGKLREEKEQLYQAAMKFYQSGEVSTALDKLEQLLALSRQTTRTPNPEKEAQYQSLYNQIRSEREAFRNGYAEARRHMEDKNFSRALALCTEFLERNPADPMFQALKLEVEEREKHERSAAVADVDRRVDTEADLDRKVTLLKEAAESYPSEPHFREALKLIRGRRDLVNSIVNKAKQYEQGSQFNEALGQWDILRSIYPQYPGLNAEAERLGVKREEQSREDAKSRWVQQIDQHLEAGEYEKAQMTVREAFAEFPSNRELASLEKLTAAALEKRAEADEHFAAGQQFCQDGSPHEGIAEMRKALELDPRNRSMRMALLGALLELGRARLNDDWRESQKLLQEALQLDDTNRVTQSLIAQVQDRERQESVDACVYEARELQAAGELTAALNKVREGLGKHPHESRLAQLEHTLVNIQGVHERDQNATLSASADPRGEPRRDEWREEKSSGASAIDADANAMTGSLAGGPMAVPAGFDRTGSIVIPQQSLAPQAGVSQSVVSQSAVPQPMAAQAAAVAVAAPETRPPLAPVRPKKKAAVSPWLWVVLASVFLIAVAVVVKYRSLAKPKSVITRLHANVPEAHFKIDGQPADAAGLLLAPDQEHVLEAAYPGYQTAVQKLTPSPNPFPATVEFNLTPLLPQLEVSTDLAGTLSIGDQTPVPLQPGSVTVNQLASGNQVIKVLAGDHSCIELPIDIQPGKTLAPPNLSAASGCSVAVVSVVGSRAHLYAGPNLSGGIAGQAQQLIPAEGVDIEATETGAEFTLSNGRTLTIQASNTPLLTIALNATNATKETAAPAAPEHHVKANAYVVLQAAEPEAEVHVDGVSRGTVSPSGIILVSIEPGNHKVFLSKAHCEDSPVVPITVRTGQTVHLGGDKFPLERQGALLFKISPPTGTASYRLGDQPQSRTAHNGDTAWMKPGKYKVQIEAAGYSPVSADYEVKPGATVEVNGKLRTGSDSAAAPAKPARDSGLEDESQWSHDANWWVLKKPTYGWMRAKQGLFNITIERSKKGIFKSAKKVEWAIDYRGEGDRVLYWIDNKTLHRIAYSDGHPIKEEVIKPLSQSGDYHLVFDVSPQRAVVSDSSGEKLDEFERPNPSVGLGKIGFHGEIAVTVQQLK